MFKRKSWSSLVRKKSLVKSRAKDEMNNFHEESPHRVNFPYTEGDILCMYQLIKPIFFNYIYSNTPNKS